MASAALGELDDEALEQLNQHLMECDPCRNRFDTMLQSNQSGLFLTEEIPAESISEMVGLELFLQRIGMANWRDLPDLGEQYRIIEKIGQGGMGEVFHCIDTRLNRMVAVKRIRPE